MAIQTEVINKDDLHCFICERQIFYGKRYFSLNCSIESEDYLQRCVNVHSSVAISLVCIACIKENKVFSIINDLNKWIEKPGIIGNLEGLAL